MNSREGRKVLVVCTSGTGAMEGERNNAKKKKAFARPTWVKGVNLHCLGGIA